MKIDTPTGKRQLHGTAKAFEEALIYGSNTVEQIKDGHHLYRCFEGHQILYLSLLKKVSSMLLQLLKIRSRSAMKVSEKIIRS